MPSPGFGMLWHLRSKPEISTLQNCITINMMIGIPISESVMLKHKQGTGSIERHHALHNPIQQEIQVLALKH